MLNQQQLAAMLIKVAVATSIASILMRFRLMQKILLRDERTVRDRLQLALIFAGIFGSTAVIRLLSHHQYKAIDIAFEGSIVAGMFGGYVTGLITGVCASMPDMLSGKFMSMPLYAAAGLIGALMHDLAPEREDIWHFSAFVDLNLYRLLRQGLQLKRKNIERRVVTRAAFNVICNALIIAAELIRWGVHSIFIRRNTFFLFEGTPLGYLVFAASAATALFTVSLPIRVWSSFRAERQLETQHARLIEAQLAALTNQINPHFLFNTLNSVATLIRLDPAGARLMIHRLSNILRRLLRKTESVCPLREELSFVDDYHGIETVRFGDKLRFVKDVDPATLELSIPSMLLQPIIENSIKHGLAKKIDGGVISLRTWLDANHLHILVADDGVGFDQRNAPASRSGIGMSNVEERLRVLYGSRFQMLVESMPGQGTKTHIEFPRMSPAGNEELQRATA